MTAQRFYFDPREGLPYVPILLSAGGVWKEFHALLDSGATNNVLPYNVGVARGLSWEEQGFYLKGEDFLRGAPIVGVRLHGEIPPFPPLELVFAWSRSDEMPLILGHVNFFLEFDLLLSDTREFFELSQ